MRSKFLMPKYSSAN